MTNDPGAPRSKADLRAAMREARAAMRIDRRKVADRAIADTLFRRSCTVDGPVAVYLATPAEIDIDAFASALLATGRTVVAPRWNGTAYEISRLAGLGDEDLAKGPMGVREPALSEPVSPADVAVWVVPGLAFSRDGRRLGYGGGWYDRLLAAADPKAVRWGVAYSFQVTDEVPYEPHDIPMTAVITEETRLET